MVGLSDSLPESGVVWNHRECFFILGPRLGIFFLAQQPVPLLDRRLDFLGGLVGRAGLRGLLHHGSLDADVHRRDAARLRDVDCQLARFESGGRYIHVPGPPDQAQNGPITLRVGLDRGRSPALARELDLGICDRLTVGVFDPTVHAALSPPILSVQAERRKEKQEDPRKESRAHRLLQKKKNPAGPKARRGRSLLRKRNLTSLKPPRRKPGRPRERREDSGAA